MGNTGFQTRKRMRSQSTRKAHIKNPDLSSSSSEEADIVDFNAKDVMEAAVKIQGAYKDFRIRKEGSIVGRGQTTETAGLAKQEMTDMEKKPVSSVEVELKDLNVKHKKEVVSCIGVHEGTKVQKQTMRAERSSLLSCSSEEANELPDLNSKDVKNAALKIQGAYKCFQERKK